MFRTVAIALACALGLVGAAQALDLKVLSSRPDMVSSGDALIEVTGASPGSPVNLVLNGRDISGVLHPEGQGLRALIVGLNLGDNSLQARQGDQMANLVLKNHRRVGPIVSGPQIQPYECRTVESGLGQPTDGFCSAPSRIDYFYRTKTGEWKPLTSTTAKRPADLATTTTIEGKTVPYIVRVEGGTMNRSIYHIAILDDPRTETVLNWKPTAGWNGRLAVVFEGGSGAKYNQGVHPATQPLHDLYLSRGFAVIVSTEFINAQHTNAVLQGETLSMLKELFIERYGAPKWTVGAGASGGAIQQILITQMYPGLLDGLQPGLTYPDSMQNTPDCGLFERFWAGAGASWSDTKRQAVEGFSRGTCAHWNRTFVTVSQANYKPGCALNDESLVWDAKTNPKGARCAVQEFRVAYYGRDPQTGYARSTRDNVGLQYGLGALNAGRISVDEFLDLNEKIGGNDNDGNFITGRTTGDPIALKAAYETGFVSTGKGGLANVPILHFRTYNDFLGDIHDRARDLSFRDRLRRDNGRADNDVIWVAANPRTAAEGKGPPMADVALAPLALDAMTQWLDAIAADPSPLSTDKVVRHKPPEAVDAYWDKDGKKIAEVASWDGKGGFNTTFPLHSEPRLVAGAPKTNDVLKCQLKPFDARDYKARFSAAQQARAKAIFSTGVCDWSKPGVGQAPHKGGWQRF